MSFEKLNLSTKIHIINKISNIKLLTLWVHNQIEKKLSIFQNSCEYKKMLKKEKNINYFIYLVYGKRKELKLNIIKII